MATQFLLQLTLENCLCKKNSVTRLSSF